LNQSNFQDVRFNNLRKETIMIKTTLAALLVLSAFAGGAEAAMMKKMDHMGMMKKCGKGMMMMHGKCTMDKMHMMKKK
jgi:trehalose-6-phosphate synthase